MLIIELQVAHNKKKCNVFKSYLSKKTSINDALKFTCKVFRVDLFMLLENGLLFTQKLLTATGRG